MSIMLVYWFMQIVVCHLRTIWYVLIVLDPRINSRLVDKVNLEIYSDYHILDLIGRISDYIYSVLGGAELNPPCRVVTIVTAAVIQARIGFHCKLFLSALII